MHDSCQQFLTQEIGKYSHLSQGWVLDIGSKRFHGQWSPRELFPVPPRPCDPRYIGIDWKPGEGVDMVMDAHDMLFKDMTFPMILSSNMLEHDSYPEATVFEAFRVLAPGGVLILSAAGPGWGPHEVLEAGDGHYRNIEEAEAQTWLQRLPGVMIHAARVEIGWEGSCQDIRMVVEKAYI